LTGLRVLTHVRLDLTRRIGIRWLRRAGAARAAALAPAATAYGGGLAGLGRKRPSGRVFDRGLHGKDAGATGTASRGSGWRDGGRRGAHGGGARPRNFGEESRVREGGEEGENRPAVLLTATRSSWGTCSMAESGGAAGRRAAEMRLRQACAASVCEARAAAAG
jgi:hypothetical protein